MKTIMTTLTILLLAGFAALPILSHAVDDGLVAYWTFNEKDGDTASDLTGNGHDGSLIGDPQWVDGYFGGALEFNQAGDEVNVPFHADLNQETFTICAWANVEPGSRGYRAVVSSRDTPPQSGYIFYVTPNNKWEFWTGSNTWNKITGPDMKPGEWEHIAGIYTDGKQKFYVNGELVGEKDSALTLNQAQELLIGAGANEKDHDFFFKGMIDEVRIYDRELSVDEIASVMESDPSFDITLVSGLNLISIPLMPAEPYTAKSLAEMLSATVVIKLDAAKQSYVGYSAAEEGEGFGIDGSSGYIVNTPAGGDFTFTGMAWYNQSDDAAAAPKIATTKRAWAFVITSNLQDKEAGASYTLVAKNLRTGVVTTEDVTSNKGHVSAVWADLNLKSVIEVGDKIEIVLHDEQGTIVSGPFQHKVTTTDIHNAYMSVQMQVGNVRPKEMILGQNFPNPFNPETWIPYQLSRDTNVTIKIYDVSGHLVRTLNLGHKSIGSYMTNSTAAYWDGKNGAGEHVSSGIYFYALQTESFSATRRMVILK